jgi:acyl carrier protein
MSGHPAENQTPAEMTMAQRLVEALSLDGVEPASIVPTAPLFGTGGDGLGLDSIDALEIALMIQQHYGIELRSDDPETKPAFASLRALTAHVLQKRAAA